MKKLLLFLIPFLILSGCVDKEKIRENNEKDEKACNEALKKALNDSWVIMRDFMWSDSDSRLRVNWWIIRYKWKDIFVMCYVDDKKWVVYWFKIGDEFINIEE